jgi:hypothetical protein
MKKVPKKETPPHWQAIVIEMKIEFTKWQGNRPKSKTKVIPISSGIRRSEH